MHTLIRFSCRLPVFRRDDGQTDLAFLVDIRVIDLGFKCDFWRLEWILRRKVNFDLERAAIIWGVLLER